jgi:hypothetical protein
MKKFLFAFLQFLLFLVTFAVGSFLHPLNIHSGITVSAPGVTRYFVADGLILAIGVLIAIVVIQVIRKRMCNTTWTVIAFVAAIALGYAMKLGFVTREF